MFKSVLFQLVDVLVWFKQYVDGKPKTKNWQLIEADNDVSQNETWIEGEWISGRIKRIAENGWGTLLPNSSIKRISIPPKMVEDNNLKEGDTISVLTKISGTKIHIKEIKI